MNGAVVVPALRPTARALRWQPTLAVVAVLLAVQAVAAARDQPSALRVVGAGLIAAAATAALHDPADELLAALPVGRLARRALRLAMLGLVTVPVVVLLAALVPATNAVGPTLALTLTGLAGATWLPPRRLAAAVACPVGWTAAALWLDTLPTPLREAATWWATHPWHVVLVASLAIVLGRNR